MLAIVFTSLITSYITPVIKEPTFYIPTEAFVYQWDEPKFDLDQEYIKRLLNEMEIYQK